MLGIPGDVDGGPRVRRAHRARAVADRRRARRCRRCAPVTADLSVGALVRVAAGQRGGRPARRAAARRGVRRPRRRSCRCRRRCRRCTRALAEGGSLVEAAAAGRSSRPAVVRARCSRRCPAGSGRCRWPWRRPGGSRCAPASRCARSAATAPGSCWPAAPCRTSYDVRGRRGGRRDAGGEGGPAAAPRSRRSPPPSWPAIESASMAIVTLRLPTTSSCRPAAACWSGSARGWRSRG